MPVFKIVRFAVRPDACSEVEQAMREFALRNDQPKVICTARASPKVALPSMVFPAVSSPRAV